MEFFDLFRGRARDEGAMSETCSQQGKYYEDEPILLSPERKSSLLPKEYRKMRDLAFGSAFDRSNDAKIFYLQAKNMEDFEDDCPYKGNEIIHYFTTYQSLSTAELRGYFTWRTRLRHGQLEETTTSFAYLYVYELLAMIGCSSKEDALEKLKWFCREYGEIDPPMRRNMERWIADFVIYYDLPAEEIKEFLHLESDEALNTLIHCDAVSDEELMSAITGLANYGLERSKCYKQKKEELTAVICEAYRRQNAAYSKKYGRPYARKLYRRTIKSEYHPFSGAVFYKRGHVSPYEYQLGTLRTYRYKDYLWQYEAVGTGVKSKELGQFVRAADRIVRDHYGIKPSLEAGKETKAMIKIIMDTISKNREEEKAAAEKAEREKIEFDLSKLSGIRSSSDAVGKRLMTEEERYPEEKVISQETATVISASPEKTEGMSTVNAPVLETAAETPADAHADAILSGNELQFMKLLLYGGELQDFLSENHLMASVLAESVNERLFDEFADTVIEFDGDTPVIVEDYLEDLKELI